MLYEVITELDAVFYYNLLDDTFFVTVDVGVDIKYVSSDSKGFRITSYNVCYTKLLRTYLKSL